MTHQPYDPFYPLHQYHHHHQQQQQDTYVFEDHNINTLFISGIPDDVKVREIHNLFRRRPGFDSCQLKYTGRGNQVVAFATFFSHQSAMSALHALNGAKFDPQIGSTLHIELARSNSTRKRKPGSGAYVVIDKRSRSTAGAEEMSSDDGESESEEPTGTDNRESVDKDDSEITKSTDPATNPDNAGTGVNEQTEKTAEGGPSPCSTLFIANLGPNCTADELTEVLSIYPGFNGLKMRARGGMPVAFADFKEIGQADKAMEELQGSILATSDRGGMSIEYARSKMRKP